MNHQDWKPVVLRKTKTKTKANKETKTAPNNPPGTAKFRMLVNNDFPTLDKISHTTCMKIQKARQEKKMTQKELAIKTNLPVTIISKYETGKVTPDRQILVKLGNALGVKLT